MNKMTSVVGVRWLIPRTLFDAVLAQPFWKVYVSTAKTISPPRMKIETGFFGQILYVQRRP